MHSSGQAGSAPAERDREEAAHHRAEYTARAPNDLTAPTFDLYRLVVAEEALVRGAIGRSRRLDRSSGSSMLEAKAAVSPAPMLVLVVVVVVVVVVVGCVLGRCGRGMRGRRCCTGSCRVLGWSRCSLAVSGVGVGFVTGLGMWC
jgi:hypothetical protein